MNHKLEIIYEDSEIVVCHKLSGIPVQTSNVRQQDMISLLRNYYSEKKENTDIFVVHRLDQPVEGVMVFARTKQAASSLSRQVQEKHVDKCYLALVEGIFAKHSGVMEDALLRDGRTNTSRVVPKGTKGAKTAKLSYEVIKTVAESEIPGLIAGEIGQKQNDTNYSLIRIQLETGRHHQIRVQMAHAGHPIAGDKKYGRNDLQKRVPLALCSIQITFHHPASGKRMEFTVEPKGMMKGNSITSF